MRVGFDVWVTQRYWVDTKPSKRQRENEATSLSFVKHYKECLQSFWVLFFKESYIYICTHIHTYIYIYVVHTRTFFDFRSYSSVRRY